MGYLVGVDLTSVTNQTADDDINQCDQRDTKAHLFFMLVYTLVFVVGLVLNSLTLKVYFCSAQQQVSSIMMVYMRNLAACDFLLCVCLPLHIIKYISSSVTFQLVYCNFAVLGLYLNMYASILFMGYIAGNRYLKIIYPLGNHFLRTVQAARIISTVTWIFLLAPVISYVTLSLLTQEPLTAVPNRCESLHNAQVRVFYKIIHVYSTVTFLVVLVSLVFFYHSASRSVLQAQQRQLASSSCKKLRRSRRKMLVLVSVFCVCFMPYHLVRLPYVFLHRQCSLSKVFYYLKELTVLLSVLNVCLDPFIYFMFCKAFRSQLTIHITKRRNEGQPRATNSCTQHRYDTASSSRLYLQKGETFLRLGLLDNFFDPQDQEPSTRHEFPRHSPETGPVSQYLLCRGSKRAERY
ncbi:P2Y purinoceptor 14-like [Scomber scombrus]|uniref:P2Y purinoceptor 14-like n=1 Tax=Scomber scombrus TaxID=13677 RepID=UPI002DDB94BC|nr:P2Y purinoceptor 14-like [Scomber scombrus]